MRRVALVLIAALIALPGCDFVAGLYARNDEPRVREAYDRFRNAMLAGDMAAVTSLIAKDRQSDFAGPDAVAKFQMAAALYPRQVAVKGVQVTGKRATLKASSLAEGGTATGTIEFVKEDGQWRVAKESWEIKIGSSEPPPQPASPDVARPADWHRFRGEWQGTETGKSGNWTFTFGDNYLVRARSDAGEWFEGNAVIRWELGRDKDGSTRVPPGAYVFDVDVTQSASPEFTGKPTLGALSLHFDAQMDYCASRPGSNIRPRSYRESTDTIRCFKLNKTSGAPTLAATAPTPEATRSSPRAASSSAPAAQPPKTARTEEVPGRAIVVKDGVAQTYVLRSGFHYDTRFKNPQRATLHFQPPSADDSTSGLRITLDATQTGIHYADGQSIHDMMFNNKPLQVGTVTPQGRAADLQWIAYGGQHFPPKRGTGCTITLTSPYTGTAAGILAGKIASCLIHSAGIDSTLDSVQFTMQGASLR